MKNLYFLIVGQLKPFFFIFLFLTFFSSLGQQININETALEKIEEIDLKQKGKSGFFSEAKRAREFSINNKIKRPNELSVGQKIKLDLFQNRRFSSVVQNKFKDINGVITYTIKLEDYNFSYAYLSLSDDTYSMQIDLPELGEHYSLKPNNAKNGYYIFQLDKTKFDKIEKCGVAKEKENKHHELGNNLEEGDLSSQTITGACPADNDFVVIDVMIVYTQAALDWASINEGNIQNTIANALAISNNISQNSDLGITFNLVYSGLVDYVEDGNDYYYLRTNGEGKMDEVHQIRKQVGADLVTLLSDLDYALGVASLLTDRYGDPTSAFSVVRMSSASYGTTFMHELGHCLGAHHNPYQKSQPGPTKWRNWNENTWSGGWRWASSDGQSYTSVMSYPYAQAYDDGIASKGVPYFSDPDLIYLGASAGNTAEGNNVRTIRDTKYSVAQYSETLAYCEAFVEERFNAYITNVKIGNSENASGISNYKDYGYLGTCVAPQEEIMVSVNTTDYKSNTVLRSWIDWNNDKVFDDSEEVFASEKHSETYDFSFKVPLGESAGNKKMRLRLIDLESSKVLGSCGKSISGEIEDYTISLYEPYQCEVAAIPQNISVDKTQSESILLSWDILEGVDSYELQYKRSSEAEWTKVNGISYPNFEIRGLSSLTEYQFQLRSICGSQASEYSELVSTFTEPQIKEIEFLNNPIDGAAIQKLEPISLQILDVNGDISNSVNQVTLSLIDTNGAGAILSGPTSLSAEEGKVVFESLSIDLPGSYRLKASVEGIPEITSSQFILSDYSPVNYVVNTISDTEDINLSDEICADIDGNCSLRAAIQNSNRSKGKDKVTFNITGIGPHRIILTKSLPAIVEPINLDATTQTGYSFDNSQIIIDGNGIAGISEEEGFYAFGLMGNSSGSEIRGFTVGGFDAGLYSLAFHLRNTGNHIIQANKIGVTADGTAKFSNFDGIYLNSSQGNIIGGTLPETRNIISGNYRGLTFDDSRDNEIIGNYIGLNHWGNDTIQNSHGISGTVDPRKNGDSYSAFSNNNRITGNVIAGNQYGLLIIGENNIIMSNLIGTNPAGDQVLGNEYGIFLPAGKSNQIGASDEPNIISGNNYGIWIRNSIENIISHNLIGTDKSGLKSLPNEFGIFVSNNKASFSTGQLIESNLISGNNTTGIYLESNHNQLSGNKIGTDLSGTIAISNKNGIHIIDGEQNTIGGSFKSQSNLISGNVEYGIWLDTGHSNNIIGNKIGIGSSTNIVLPNGKSGILIEGSSNSIGEIGNNSSNIIANHPDSGITVINGYARSVNNKIAGNELFGNGIGIDLNGEGLTVNDPKDSDSGSNNLQNYPDLNNASFESTLKIEYRWDSDPAYSSYPILIQIYKSDGNRQGKEFLGEFSLLEKDVPKGKKPVVGEVELISGTSLISGDLIVATATDGLGNTSEFSPEISVDVIGSCTQQTWFADFDGDGLGNPSDMVESCTAPEGYVSNSDDCDDTDPDIGALQTWYRDADGDGFGDLSSSVEDCTQQPGYILDNTDCDDSDNTIYPGALDDSVDGTDQDCNGADGPVTSCPGTEILVISETCSTTENVYWEITNPNACEVQGRWELRKSSSSGASSGSFILAGGESIDVISGTVDKGKTQIIVYWTDSDRNELNTNQNASGVDCASGMSTLSGDDSLVVAPNPVTEGIGMYFTAPTDNSILTASVYNSSGQMMASQSFSVAAGISNLLWEVDHSSWIDGVYILNVSIEDQTYQTQFIK